jgi:hypothetical protein
MDQMIDQMATACTKALVLIAVSLVTHGCSTNAHTGSIGSAGLHFDHRIEKLRRYKTALTVVATSDVRDNRVNFDREAQAYADRYAKHACPKGHEFYTDAPITSRSNERTFVFGCK